MVLKFRWNFADFAYTYDEQTDLPPSQEFPAAAYGPLDFHCERTLSSWNDPLGDFPAKTFARNLKNDII